MKKFEHKIPSEFLFITGNLLIYLQIFMKFEFHRRKFCEWRQKIRAQNSIWIILLSGKIN